MLYAERVCFQYLRQHRTVNILENVVLACAKGGQILPKITGITWFKKCGPREFDKHLIHRLVSNKKYIRANINLRLFAKFWK